MLQRVHDGSASAPPGYSHGVIAPAGRQLFISGQVALDGGELVGADDFRKQAHQVFLNIGKVLREAGAGYPHIAKITAFFTDLERDIACFREVRSEYLNMECAPASSALEVGALVPSGVLLEVECVAVLPDRG